MKPPVNADARGCSPVPSACIGGCLTRRYEASSLSLAHYDPHPSHASWSGDSCLAEIRQVCLPGLEGIAHRDNLIFRDPAQDRRLSMRPCSDFDWLRDETFPFFHIDDALGPLGRDRTLGDHEAGIVLFQNDLGFERHARFDAPHVL